MCILTCILPVKVLELYLSVWVYMAVIAMFSNTKVAYTYSSLFGDENFYLILISFPHPTPPISIYRGMYNHDLSLARSST